MTRDIEIPQVRLAAIAREARKVAADLTELNYGDGILQQIAIQDQLIHLLEFVGGYGSVSDAVDEVKAAVLAARGGNR